MIKVIIVDDENRICRLIEKLINWKSIDMEVVGIGNDGVEGFELIKKYNPEVVITDIRMPGYDGLEMIEKSKEVNENINFIIISGYEEFDYAKKAMQFGVRDYILKPINREILLSSLKRIKNDFELEIDYNPNRDVKIMNYEDNINLIRESFLNKVIFAYTKSYFNKSLEEINEKYYFKFKNGIFNIVCIKLDSDNLEKESEIKKIMKDIKDKLDSLLKQYCYDIEIVNNYNTLYLLINYDKSLCNDIRECFIKLLRLNNQLQNGCITLSIGKSVSKFNDIQTSLESSQMLIENRIFKNKGTIIDKDDIKNDKDNINTVFMDFSKKYINSIQLFDVKSVEDLIDKLEKDIESFSIRGMDLKIALYEFTSIYYFTIRSYNIEIDSQKELYKLKKNIENSSTVSYLFKCFKINIISSLKLLLENKSYSNLGKIGLAKKYIEDEYMNNITLEDIGAYVGFNPSYFSSLFKKETGTSFIEYLSEIRIKKAKELLKESDLKIQDISLMVGYKDVKYFTKSFSKFTGIKPNEYRKIFL